MEKNHLLSEDNENNIFLEGNIPKGFKDLDQTFRCLICANLFDKAVTIKECGHTFCSVCIRNYWVTIRNGVHRQERSCPICRTSVSIMDVEKALVMNRCTQEGVKAFKQMLLTHYRSSKDQIQDSLPHRSKRRRRSSERKLSATAEYDQSSHEDKIYISGNDSKSGEEEIPVQQKMESRNYSRMKKKELRRLCSEFKIPTSGSEQELMDRLRNYQNMWNAEVLHSIDPKNPSTIAAKLKKQEKAQQDEKKKAQMTGAANSKECLRKLNASLRNGNQKITSGDSTFDIKLKENFKAMTTELRSRMKKKIASCTASDKNVRIDNSFDEGDVSEKKELSRRIEEMTCMSVQTASSIEMIDVDSCSDLPDRSITVSTMDMKQKNESLSNPALSNGFPKSSSCSTNLKTTVAASQRIIASQSSEKKRKRISRASSLASSRVGWACSRCTYVNKGIDYVCQICGCRKT